MKYQVEPDVQFYAPEGYVLAELKSAEEVPTQFGKRLRLTFNDGKGDFSIWVSPKINNRTNLGFILKGMGVSFSEGDVIDLDTLVGKKVGLIMAKNDAGFPKLIQVVSKDKPPF